MLKPLSELQAGSFVDTYKAPGRRKKRENVEHGTDFIFMSDILPERQCFFLLHTFQGSWSIGSYGTKRISMKIPCESSLSIEAGLSWPGCIAIGAVKGSSQTPTMRQQDDFKVRDSSR